ncbi:hypothetical protein V1290_002529 [Bradyrhizobium sp. AZCC 1578]
MSGRVHWGHQPARTRPKPGSNRKRRGRRRLQARNERVASSSADQYGDHLARQKSLRQPSVIGCHSVGVCNSRKDRSLMCAAVSYLLDATRACVCLLVATGRARLLNPRFLPSPPRLGADPWLKRAAGPDRWRGAAASWNPSGKRSARYPRPPLPQSDLRPLRFQQGDRAGVVAKAHCLILNVTGQLLADDWGGATESGRCRRWREGSAWARGARWCRR